MDVVWDPEKDEANRAKHGVGFAEASELFRGDGDYLDIFDEAHSEAEDRFIAIGPIQNGLVLVVYTDITDDVVRIISARWAEKPEIERYRRHVGGSEP